MAKSVNWELVYQELRKGLSARQLGNYRVATRDKRREWLEKNRTIIMGSSGRSGKIVWLHNYLLNNSNTIAVVADVKIRERLRAALIEYDPLGGDYRNRVFTARDLESLSEPAAISRFRQLGAVVIVDSNHNFKRAMVYNYISAYSEISESVVVIRLENVYGK